jgi:hypothetical protein
MKTLTLMAALVLGASAAELSHTHGKVWIRAAETAGWTAGAAGTLLAAGAHVKSGSRSSAGLELAPALSVELNANTEVVLEQAEAAEYGLSVVKGTVDYYVAPDFTGHAVIGTPTVSVQSALSGFYRIEVKDSGQTEVIANQGAVQVVAPEGSQWVNAGQKLTARNSAAGLRYKIGGAVSFWKRAALVLSNMNVAVAAIDAGGGGGGQDRHHDHNAGASHDHGGNHDSKPPAGKTAPPSKPSGGSKTSGEPRPQPADHNHIRSR